MSKLPKRKILTYLVAPLLGLAVAGGAAGALIATNKMAQRKGGGTSTTTYVVTFMRPKSEKINGGIEFETATTQKVVKGELATKPDISVPSGKKVKAWYKDADYQELFDFSKTTITSNLTLYAEYEDVQPSVTQYSVTCTAGDFVATQKVNEGEFATEPSVPLGDQEFLDGWTDKDTGKKFVFSETAIYKDTNLIGNIVYKPVTTYHTVTFMIGESVHSTQSVPTGNLATEPVVTIEGKIVEGWYTEPEFKSKFDFTTPIESDKTLYANLVDKPTTTYHSVKCYADGALVSEQNIEDGKCATQPAVSVEGKVVEGWYAEDSFKTKFSFTTPIKNDVTVYAKLVEATEFKLVTFNAGDHGSFGGEQTSSAYIQKGKTFGEVTRPSLTAEEDYLFKEWKDASGNTVSDSTVVNDNMTVTAHYEMSSQDIVLTLNASAASATLTGNNTLTITKNATKWETIKTKLPTPTKTQHTFLFWYKDTDAEGNPIQIDDATTFSSATTLYPAFEFINPIILTVKTSGTQVLEGSSTIEVNPSSTTTFGDLNKPKVTDAGKSFAGWYKAEVKDQTEPELETIKWNDTDEISTETETLEIWPRFVQVVTNPVITFAADPKETEIEESKITWIGNKVVKCDTTDGVASSLLNKPIVYYDLPESGEYKSNYYLNRWYYYDNGEKQDLPQTITKSITVYPEFELKPKIQFAATYESEKVTNEVFVDPGTLWSDVAKPKADGYTEGESYFMCWQGVLEGETEYKDIEPTTNINNLDLDYPIKPNVQASCNIINFLKDGVDTSGEPKPVTYMEGNENVGVWKNKDVLFSNVNKPIPILEDYTFVKWQINKGTTELPDWQDVDDNTYIPKTGEGEDPSTTQIRPVMQQNFTITYNNNGGEIVGEETTTVSSTIPFSKMYRPAVNPPENKQFLYWATKDALGNYTKVAQNKTFSADTELFAVYDDDVVSSTVQFKLKDEDISGDFATSISGTTYTKNHSTTEEGPAFSSIPKAVATKNLHPFRAWQIKKADGNYEDVADDYAIPNDTKDSVALVVYADFSEPQENYKKITIQTSTEYEITPQNYCYVKYGDPFPFNEFGQLGANGENITIKKQGSKVKSWKDTDGNEWTSGKTVEDNITIIPEFEDQTVRITFSKDNDTSISMDEKYLDVPIHANLKNAISGNTPAAQKDKSDLIGWKIKTGDGQYQEITDTTEASSNLILVPMFRGESEFLFSDKAYFYDTEKGKWAQITNYSDKDDNLVVYYGGGTGETGVKSKATFNYEVKFGTQMKKIPDNFMKNCIAWNNGATSGESIPLVFPTGLTEVGYDVMYGCVAFNQPLDFTKAGAQLQFGENFMRSCYSFNSNIDFTSTHQGAQVLLSSGFMFDCNSFTANIIIKDNYIDWNTCHYDDYILSSSNKYAPIKQTGFKIITNGDIEYRENLQARFKVLDGPTYRSCTVEYQA